MERAMEIVEGCFLWEWMIVACVWTMMISIFRKCRLKLASWSQLVLFQWDKISSSVAPGLKPSWLLAHHRLGWDTKGAQLRVGQMSTCVNVIRMGRLGGSGWRICLFWRSIWVDSWLRCGTLNTLYKGLGIWVIDMEFAESTKSWLLLIISCIVSCVFCFCV